MDIAAFRKRLLDEKAALIVESESGREARKPVELDQQSVGRLSRMDAMQGQAMAIEAERRRKARLHQVEAALDDWTKTNSVIVSVVGKKSPPNGFPMTPQQPNACPVPIRSVLSTDCSFRP